MPRAYMETILSSKPGKRRWYLAMSCGSKVASARDLQRQLAGAGQHRLRAITVAAVGPAVRLAALEVVIQLGVQRPLGQGLLQPVQQAPVGQGGPGIGSVQQLIQQLKIGRASCRERV